MKACVWNGKEENTVEVGTRKRGRKFCGGNCLGFGRPNGVLHIFCGGLWGLDVVNKGKGELRGKKQKRGFSHQLRSTTEKKKKKIGSPAGLTSKQKLCPFEKRGKVKMLLGSENK